MSETSAREEGSGLSFPTASPKTAKKKERKKLPLVSYYLVSPPPLFFLIAVEL